MNEHALPVHPYVMPQRLFADLGQSLFFVLRAGAFAKRNQQKKSTFERMVFTQIPSEVLEIVLSFSDANSIISLSSGCKQLRADCLNTDSVWSRLCEFDWATSDRDIIYKWTGSSEEDLMVVEEEPQSISPRFFDLYKQMHLTFRQYKPIFHSVASKWLRIEAVFKKQTNSRKSIFSFQVFFSVSCCLSFLLINETLSVVPHSWRNSW